MKGFKKIFIIAIITIFSINIGVIAENIEADPLENYPYSNYLLTKKGTQVLYFDVEDTKPYLKVWVENNSYLEGNSEIYTAHIFCGNEELYTFNIGYGYSWNGIVYDNSNFVCLDSSKLKGSGGYSVHISNESGKVLHGKVSVRLEEYDMRFQDSKPIDNQIVEGISNKLYFTMNTQDEKYGKIYIVNNKNVKCHMILKKGGSPTGSVCVDDSGKNIEYILSPNEHKAFFFEADETEKYYILLYSEEQEGINCTVSVRLSSDDFIK